MRTVHVIVEGDKDLYFLHEFVLQRFGALFARKENEIPKTVKECGNPLSLESVSRGIKLDIFRAGGFTSVNTYRSCVSRPPELEARDEFASSIIFDADYPGTCGKNDTNGGGFAHRVDFILDRLGIDNPAKRAQARRQIFLFPDNLSDGDLEALMERMVIQTPDHKTFLDVCWSNFEKCVASHHWNRPTGKSRMNEFTAAFNSDIWEINGINRSFTFPDLWDWSSPALSPLHAFLARLLTGMPPESFDGLVERE